MDKTGNPLIDNDIDTNLEFQNFGLSVGNEDLSGNVKLNNAQTTSDSYNFNVPPVAPESSSPSQPQTNKSFSFWQFEYYSDYFNVDTKEVVNRITMSVVPKSSFFEAVGDNPDLYGPVWIPTTVIFALFVTSSIAKSIVAYITGDSSDNIDYNLLTYATCTVYVYAFAVPLAVWAIGKWFGAPLTWLSLTSLYGYGMAIWVPVSLACVAPFEWIRWLIVIGAYVWSIVFMLRAIIPAIKSSPAKTKLIVVGLVSGVHFVLVILFKFWFFHYVIAVSSTSPNSGTNTGSSNTTTT